MVEIIHNDTPLVSSDKNQNNSVDAGEEYQYKVICAVLYGTKTSLFVAALALGKQLANRSAAKRYLLHDDSAVVDGDRKAALAHYWNLKEVHRISSPESCHTNAQSLKDIFTKLRVLEVLREGAEVLLLDLDVVVVGDVDALFAAPSPAGKFHGCESDVCVDFHGCESDCVDFQGPLTHGSTLSTRDFKPYTCVNAGVLRLRAGKEAFDSMMQEIERRRTMCDYSQRSYLPEQYLLVYDDWFKKSWFLLDEKYNREVDPRLEKMPLAELENTVIAHFSCNKLKPWDYLGSKASDLSAVFVGERPDCDFYRWTHARFLEWEAVVADVAVELKHFQGVAGIIEGLKKDAAWWQQRRENTADAKRLKSNHEIRDDAEVEAPL